MLNREFDIAEFRKTLPSMEMEIAKISLMKSERFSGKLVYTEIYKKDLI